MAFLCLMPAHFEWPDKLEMTSEHAFDDFSSLQEHMPPASRDHVTRRGHSGGLDLLAILADSTLLRESSRFGSCRRLLTMQSFDQLARQRRFGVARLHREYSLDLIDG